MFQKGALKPTQQSIFVGIRMSKKLREPMAFIAPQLFSKRDRPRLEFGNREQWKSFEDDDFGMMTTYTD